MSPPDKREPPLGTGADADTKTYRQPEDYNDGGQWAKLYKWVAARELNGTAFRVLIALAAHAGPSRLTWPSHVTVAAEVGVSRQAVTAAIRRLIKARVIEEAGLMRNPAKGAWTRRYRILDTHPDQRVATQLVASGGAEGLPDATNGLPDATNRGPDATQLVARSSTKGSVPKEAVDAQFGIERDPNPNGQPQGAPTEELKEFWFKGEWHPYKGARP